MPQATIAYLKIRSGISPLLACRSGAVHTPSAEITFVGSTGCGPGISGRCMAGLAIPSTVADGCYKGVKITWISRQRSLCEARHGGIAISHAGL